MDVLSLNPARFAKTLRDDGVGLAWVAHLNGHLQVSHAALDPLKQYFGEAISGYASHEAIFLRAHAEHDVLMAAFVHDTTRGQGAGGTRLWGYEDMRGFLRDGLRLSQGMTRKNSLAGLWWGGGKGVIGYEVGVRFDDRTVRDSIFNAYGAMMTELRGCYVTAEDVGAFTRDIGAIHQTTRFVTCIPQEIGGSGDPSPHTARGVVAAAQAALEHRKMGTLAGKTVAVQGIGNVGGPLVKYFFEAGVAKIIASDVSAELVEKRRKEFPADKFEVRVTPRGDQSVLAEQCDIFAPCALGAILNPATIPLIKAKVVCGAANNQLDDSNRDGAALQARNITYVPDFLVNRMGIVNCANEQYGYATPDPAIERHFTKGWDYSIPRMTREVLDRTDRDGVHPAAAAVALADELARAPHPIFPERSRQIIASLTRSG
ncbi:MAG: Glu/Leu/Phe/Val dehydrogenase [Clostridia bacterium]|nr:Glu/Leu/Phe/Val dehydrogenase [Deltaproteobacteria bacterium]